MKFRSCTWEAVTTSKVRHVRRSSASSSCRSLIREPVLRRRTRFRWPIGSGTSGRPAARVRRLAHRGWSAAANASAPCPLAVRVRLPRVRASESGPRSASGPAGPRCMRAGRAGCCVSCACATRHMRGAGWSCAPVATVSPSRFYNVLERGSRRHVKRLINPSRCCPWRSACNRGTSMRSGTWPILRSYC